MAPTEEQYCPDCDEDTSHRLIARTRLHLGIKRKWRCETCENRIVTIDGEPLTVANKPS